MRRVVAILLLLVPVSLRAEEDRPDSAFLNLLWLVHAEGTTHAADAACPSVSGAAVRISMPYVDPKLYDDTEFEARKYAERRDDMGRTLLAVMMQARLRLVSEGKL